MSHQGVISIDGFKTRKPYGCAFNASGKTGELVRFDITNHDFEI